MQQGSEFLAEQLKSYQHKWKKFHPCSARQVVQQRVPAKQRVKSIFTWKITHKNTANERKMSRAITVQHACHLSLTKLTAAILFANPGNSPWSAPKAGQQLAGSPSSSDPAMLAIFSPVWTKTRCYQLYSCPARQTRGPRSSICYCQTVFRRHSSTQMLENTANCRTHLDAVWAWTDRPQEWQRQCADNSDPHKPSFYRFWMVSAARIKKQKHHLQMMTQVSKNRILTKHRGSCCSEPGVSFLLDLITSEQILLSAHIFQSKWMCQPITSMEIHSQ